MICLMQESLGYKKEGFLEMSLLVAKKISFVVIQSLQIGSEETGS